jgi:anaerobic selenocysteine-containing dehydrogenase
MCACRCGIKVYLKDGTVKYIEGNRDHPVNKGVLCAKGSAGIMQHYSPARLTKPLMRVGPRGSGEFKEVEWEEALRTGHLAGSGSRHRPEEAGLVHRPRPEPGADRLVAQAVRHAQLCRPRRLLLGQHGGAGIYTMGGAFWEFGEPDWDNTKYFMLFGVAEDHASNPIKTGLGKLKKNGAKIVSVNPVVRLLGHCRRVGRHRPGTDGLLILRSSMSC